MFVEKIQSIINEYNYWDLRVKKLECSYFGDEIELAYDDSKGNDITYRYVGCYKCCFDHVKNYDKFIPVKNMSIAQIPYFLQEVTISELIDDEVEFYVCKINMFPLNLEIWCKDIQVIKKQL